MDTHQVAGIQQLGQFALFDLTGQHDGVHVQPLKQLIVAAGCVGLTNGVAHVQHQFGVQIQFDIFQFHSGSLLFAAQVNAGQHVTLQEVVAGTGHDNLAGVHKVCAVADFQGLLGVLLDQ